MTIMTIAHRPTTGPAVLAPHTMASHTRPAKRERQREGAAHQPRTHLADAHKRQRVKKERTAALPQFRERRSAPPVVGTAATSTPLPATTGPDSWLHQHVAAAAAPVPLPRAAPRAPVAAGAPRADVAAQPASVAAAAVNVDRGGVAAGVARRGAPAAARDLCRTRAIVAGRALVFTSVGGAAIRLGSKLQQRCAAAAVHSKAVVTTKLAGVQYQLTVNYAVIDGLQQWMLTLPSMVADAFHSKPRPQSLGAVPLYVVAPPRAGALNVRRCGQPDGELCIDLVSQLTLGEAERVARTLRTSLDRHRDTLRSIVRDVAAAEGRAAFSRGAHTHHAGQHERPRRKAQRIACEQMLAELRVLDECQQRLWSMACPKRQEPWSRAWDTFEYEGFGLAHAAAALGLSMLLWDLTRIRADFSRASPHGTPKELIARLRGTFWTRHACNVCRKLPRNLALRQVVEALAADSDYTAA